MSEPRDRTDRSGPEQIRSQLKPERIQEPLEAEQIQAELKPERIQAHLAELPGWSVADGGSSLVRTYEFPTVRASALFVQLIAEIGDAAGYLPDIDLRYLKVTVAVDTSQKQGLHDLDFTIARMLDSRLGVEVGEPAE